MKQEFLYITDEDFHENGSLKNPVINPDNKLEEYYPEFSKVNFELKLTVVKKPTKEEKESPIYKDIFEKIGREEIMSFKETAQNKHFSKVLLNGFRQEHFDYVASYLKDATEVLYLFKCPKINDLSALAEFKKLKYLCVYWNNSLESLWNMEKNTSIEALSFITVSKIKNISDLQNSKVRYVNFDSSDNCGNKKECIFLNPNVFENMPDLKHLKLFYKNLEVDY